jgi:hypothetical protein
MSYVNLNNPANFQLQEFEQLGFRYIVSGRPTISGETYRTIFVLTDAVVTATCPNGDSLSSETLVAGTVIHGFFEDVSVASGSLLAYKAGPITAQEIFDAYKAYVYAQGGIVEGESCAVADIAALLEDKLYSAASLVLIPSGYKVSHLYAERPLDSNGDLTFTRASSATRVGPDGLIEKVRTNVLTYSNTFSNAAWVKENGATVTAGQSGYDGSTNAWKLEAPTAGSSRDIFHIYSASAPLTFSVYAKAGSTDWIRINLSGIGNQYFNLANGTAGSGSGIPYSITPAGNGYYRISISGLTGSIAAVYIFLASGDVDINVSAGDNIYIQDAQLETSDIATDYIPTTTTAVSVGPVANLPRIDYTGGGCGKLLLEPQRTNLFNFSEQIDNAGWTKQGLTITANSAVSPDGYTNADLLDDGTSASTQHWFFQGTTLANSTTYTLSLYAKYVSRQNMIINIFNGASSQYVVYNIQNGTIVGSTGDVTASITSVGSGWYRLTYTRAMAASGSPNHRIGLADDTGSETYTGSNKQTLIYGCQIEAGAYPTSYIGPTLGAAVTRLVDAASKTGISSLIGQTEGVMFLDFEKTNNDVGVVQISDGTTLNRIYVGISSTTIIVQVRSGGGAAQAFFNFAATNDTRYKCAIAYKENDFVLYINGNQEGIDTSGLVPASFSQLQTSDIVSSNFINPINQILLFKTRLSNAQLAELTTI